MRDLAPFFATRPALSEAMQVLEQDGHAVHLVGGAVRNALMGLPASDLDLSTNARPDQVAGLFEAAGATVHPTGIDHGTVTVVLNDTVMEITTWRRDVATDGRRATVAFADRIEDDAMRRDFTINALYADRRGVIVDPTGTGIDDLVTLRLRYVGNAETRIREDHLRILRYFRFIATHGCQFEPGSEAAEASARLAPLTDSLPRERVGAEMLKLLAASDPRASLKAMEACGLLDRVLPGFEGIGSRLDRLIGQEQAFGLAPCPMRRLAALTVAPLLDALKLSKSEARMHALLAKATRGTMGPGELAYRQDYELAETVLILRTALGDDLAASVQALSEARVGAETAFPIGARDLMDRFQGGELGATLRRLETAWIESRFTASRQDLLAQA